MPTTEILDTTTELLTQETALTEEAAAEEATTKAAEESTSAEAEGESETVATTGADADGGVWGNRGGADMSLTDALGVSVVGFGIVFAVLGFLAAFVYAMGKVFETVGKKAEKKKEAEKNEEPVQNSVNSNEYPLPENQSIGDLTLINTTEEEAAVIMAITSNKSGIPLNRLKFNSIKLLEDDKK